MPEKGADMKFYCVVQKYYDNGKVNAWITNHVSSDVTIPESKLPERSTKDVCYDYFTDRDEAIRFCDEIKEA